MVSPHIILHLPRLHFQLGKVVNSEVALVPQRAGEDPYLDRNLMSSVPSWVPRRVMVPGHLLLRFMGALCMLEDPATRPIIQRPARDGLEEDILVSCQNEACKMQFYSNLCNFVQFCQLKVIILLLVLILGTVPLLLDRHSSFDFLTDAKDADATLPAGFLFVAGPQHLLP